MNTESIFISSIKNVSLRDQAVAVFEYTTDNFDYKKDTSGDYWKTPEEFRHDVGGDCEDFAIYYRSLLLRAGVPEERLWLAQIPWRPMESHLVLLVEDGNSYYFLSCFSYEVPTFSKDELVDFLKGKSWRTFNTKNCISFNAKGLGTLREAKEVPQWVDCLRRMQNGTK